MRTLRAGASAGLVLVVVACAVDPLGFRPYTTLRWAVVGVASALAAAAIPAPAWRRLASTPLLAAWVGLLACLAVATIVAVDPLVALVGHPRRHLGLAGWLVGALAFAAGAGTGLRGPGARRRLGRAGVVAGAVTGLGALADLFGWDPPSASFGDGRIGGLLGQPAYLGAAAVLLAPLAVGVAAGEAADTAAGRWWRRAALATAAACVVAVLASQTRGAWVALVAAAGVAWPVVRGWVAARRRVLAAGLVVLASLVVAGPFGLLGSRAIAGFDPVTGSGRGRLDEWAVAAAVVADHPLTGVGPEGYRIAAPGHIGDRYAQLHGRDEVVDRAHNGLLDVAVTGGLPAAGLYAVLLGGALVRCARALSHRPEGRDGPDPLVAGAAAGVVAWVGQQVVSFPIAEVDPAAWLLAGMVVMATERPAIAPPEDGTNRRAAAARLGAGALAPAPAIGSRLGLGVRGERGARAAWGGLAAVVVAVGVVVAVVGGPVGRWVVAALPGAAALVAALAVGARLGLGVRGERGAGAARVGVGAVAAAGERGRRRVAAVRAEVGARAALANWGERGARAVRVGAGAVAVVLAVLGGLGVAADRQLHRAEDGADGDGVAALSAADRATALRPDDIDAWYVAARLATRARPGLLGVDAGLDRVEDGLRRSPRDPALRTLREGLLVERALRSALPADLRAARAAAEELAADDPAGPAHHRALGLVLAAQGQEERAAAELRRALDLDPDDAVAREALDALAEKP